MSSNIVCSRILFWIVFAAFAASVVLIGCYHLFGKGGFRPILMTKEKIVHLGEVPANSLVESKVTVTNIGVRPLKILEVRSGCSGCTKIISFPADPIYRNETVTVCFALNTESLSGKVRKSMVLISNDPIHPAYPILIDAIVKIENEQVK